MGGATLLPSGSDISAVGVASLTPATGGATSSGLWLTPMLGRWY